MQTNAARAGTSNDHSQVACVPAPCRHNRSPFPHAPIGVPIHPSITLQHVGDHQHDHAPPGKDPRRAAQAADAADAAAHHVSTCSLEGGGGGMRSSTHAVCPRHHIISAQAGRGGAHWRAHRKACGIRCREPSAAERGTAAAACAATTGCLLAARAHSALLARLPARPWGHWVMDVAKRGVGLSASARCASPTVHLHLHLTQAPDCAGGD